MKKNYKFETANDQHVGALIVFAKAADGKLYYESEFKNQVTNDDVGHFFGMNALIVRTATGMAIPVAITGTKVVTVTKGASGVEASEWAFLV